MSDGIGNDFAVERLQILDAPREQNESSWNRRYAVRMF